MPASDDRTKYLLSILARENTKTGYFQRSPAVFREMQGDTHKTMPAANFGPSPDLLPSGFSGAPDYLTVMKTDRVAAKGRRAESASAKAAAQAARGTTGTKEYTSVFKPKPGQEHVCSLSKEHRSKVAASEWALLDTLELQIINQDKDRRQRLAASRAAEQRGHLDRQVHDKQLVEQREANQRDREARLLSGEVAAYKADEAAKVEAARERNLRTKADRLSQLEVTRQARQAAFDRRAMEEAAMLADNLSQVAAEQVAAAAKAEVLRQQAARLRVENEEKMQLKRDVQTYQRQADEEMMKTNLKLMEKQDAERDEAQKAFHANIVARTKGAGTKALDDNIERLEREARQIKLFEEQKVREEQARAEYEKARKEKQKQELLQARQEHLTLKERRLAAAREETARIRDATEAKARDEADAEARKMAGIRARALGNKDYLSTQILTREVKGIDDGVNMTDRERQINLRLLDHATRIVGYPQQLTVKY